MISFKLFKESINIERVPLVIRDNGINSYKGIFSIDKTQNMTATDILRDESYGYFFFYKGINCKLELMPPLKYLEICMKNMGYDDINTNINSHSLKRIESAVDSGEKLDMPYYTEGKIFNQEGRNRSYYANSIGEELIPICIIYDVSFEEKISKAKEICNSLSITSDMDDDSISDILLSNKYHRDVARFINMNRDIL